MYHDKAGTLRRNMINQQNECTPSEDSDQSLRYPHEETLGPKLPAERTAKTLIRLGGCPEWSESSLGAHSFFFCFVMSWLIYRPNSDQVLIQVSSKARGYESWSELCQASTKTRNMWQCVFKRYFHVHSFDFAFLDHDLSRDMTKPTKWVCAQRRLRSAWASA